MIYEEKYANQYDKLYEDKDYEGECDLIEETFTRYGIEKIHTILDFGCGTGNHSIPLAKRGYAVTGIDLSAEMLRVAKRKSITAGTDITWIEGDIRNSQVEGLFDAGLYMFAVLGYMMQNNDLMATLKNARQHIRKDGLLVFDVWYGPAVLTIKPSDRIKIIQVPGGRVLRTVTSKLDIRHHLCEVYYHLWTLIGDHLETESEELHVIRYFFPMELELALTQTNFALKSLSAFPTLDSPADIMSWNVLGVAQAI